jgi:hypothetical protein
LGVTVLDLDPAVESRLNRVAEWYNLPPERYTEIVLTRAFDALIEDNPNLEFLVELR